MNYIRRTRRLGLSVLGDICTMEQQTEKVRSNFWKFRSTYLLIHCIKFLIQKHWYTSLASQSFLKLRSFGSSFAWVSNLAWYQTCIDAFRMQFYQIYIPMHDSTLNKSRLSLIQAFSWSFTNLCFSNHPKFFKRRICFQYFSW